MDKLIEILSEIKPDIDFSTETGLIDNALLDSFDIVQIVGRLNEEFDIEITPKDIVPENFNSAEALWKMVESLQ